MKLQNNVGVCLHQEITVCHTHHKRAILMACNYCFFLKILPLLDIQTTLTEMQAKRVSLFNHSAMLISCLTGRGHHE